jgi:flagellar biogenesis protein FliO
LKYLHRALDEQPNTEIHRDEYRDAQRKPESSRISLAIINVLALSVYLLYFLRVTLCPAVQQSSKQQNTEIHRDEYRDAQRKPENSRISLAIINVLALSVYLLYFLRATLCPAVQQFLK